MMYQVKINQILEQRLHIPASLINMQSVGGGSINNCYKITAGKETYFCKTNSATKFPQLLLKEKSGLELLKKQEVIDTPEVIECFEYEDLQLLLLEWVEQGEKNELFWEGFGQQLAALHQITNDAYGLPENNYMGSVPQTNTPMTTWVDFFIENRLSPLVSQCANHKLLAPKYVALFENIYKRLPEVFDEKESPRLVHGDLWSGNFLCKDGSIPVLIDPATYYGHPSVDMGMSTLFGGFHSLFYKSYNHWNPLPANYTEQWKACNLYPLLIHLLLFGSSYISQIVSILNDFQ